ncbi:MAG: hypothetical protein BWY39_01943 [Spirochaetes bacterium ADurb.Bin269]|nr:MAG: hypothetical protein BWY39_01943 [Spirochaetes bacterium ADurb.Bin269]
MVDYEFDAPAFDCLGSDSPGFRIHVVGAVVDVLYSEESVEVGSLEAVVHVVAFVHEAGDIGSFKAALVADCAQLVRSDRLDVRAHFGSPGGHNFARLVRRIARFVDELPGHDGRVFVIGNAGVGVHPGQKVFRVRLVRFAGSRIGVEIFGLLKFEPALPGRRLLDPAEIAPVVVEGDHELDAALACFGNSIVEALECVLDAFDVFLLFGYAEGARRILGRRLGHAVDVVVAVLTRHAVHEAPYAKYAEVHRLRVIEHVGQHFVRFVVHVVVVRSGKPERLAVEHEFSARDRDEAFCRCRLRVFRYGLPARISAGRSSGSRTGGEQRKTCGEQD